MFAARNAFMAGSVPPPTFTSVSPSTINVAGAGITISGSNFVPGQTTVTVGGVLATGVSVSSTAALTCSVPATSRGAKSIVITTPFGSVSAANALTAIAPPFFSGGIFYPDNLVVAGETVGVTGGNFFGSMSASAGGVACSNVTVVNDGYLTFTMPALASEGGKDFTVTNADGSATWVAGSGATLTYYFLAPAISSVNDGRYGLGSQTGSTITLSGYNFAPSAGSTTVSIGGTTVSASVSSTSISFTCPNLGSDGSKMISVTTVGGTASTSVSFWASGRAAVTTNYVTPGSGTYTIPAWANFVDCVVVGGGQGGGPGNITSGRGGNPGLWSGTTSTITSAAGTLPYTVGSGGARGQTFPNPGANGGTSTAGSSSGAGGSGDNGGSPGRSPGNFTFGGVTYTGGAQQGVFGGDGLWPGGGGAAGATAAFGGTGARGSVWFVARQ